MCVGGGGGVCVGGVGVFCLFRGGVKSNKDMYNIIDFAHFKVSNFIITDDDDQSHIFMFGVKAAGHFKRGMSVHERILRRIL